MFTFFYISLIFEINLKNLLFISHFKIKSKLNKTQQKKKKKLFVIFANLISYLLFFVVNRAQLTQVFSYFAC